MKLTPDFKILIREFREKFLGGLIMNIKKITSNKNQYMDLLLLADESEDMIQLYLDRGDLFALYDENILRSICVVTKEETYNYELKNIATYDKYQSKGYGKKLIEYLFEYYKDVCSVMYVGTGDSKRILDFYKCCGFEESHVIKNFFIDNYDHEMYDCGQQLIDMVYLKKILK